MSFAVRQAWPTDLDALAVVAVQAQGDPERFIAYVGDDAASIAADLAEIDGVDEWFEATYVALDDARNVIGWIAAESDPELGRVWWWGPFLADGHEHLREPMADALLGAAQQSMSSIEQFEFAIDERSALLGTFAERHGYVVEEGSVVLNTTGIPVDDTADVGVEPLRAEHHDDVAALHDQIFPGTHTPGALLVGQTDDSHQRFVAVDDGRVVGYVATIFENDRSLYIDYLGVAADDRGSGRGRALITAAMRARSDEATHAHLTVRSSNIAARRLYASLDFAEERVLVPLRRGFTLA